MEDPFAVFESENNPLKESMRKILEQLPSSAEQVKSVFKSLLMVHVSKIKDKEERSTWQSFINTLDNISQGEQAAYSFGKSGNPQILRTFKQAALTDEDIDMVYCSNLMNKSITAWKALYFSSIQRKKALKSTILIGLRLKYVEGFWKWHMLAGGLEKISNEFYAKNVLVKVFNSWKLYRQEISEENYVNEKLHNFAYEYNEKRVKIVVMLNWAEYVRNSIRSRLELMRSGKDPEAGMERILKSSESLSGKSSFEKNQSLNHKNKSINERSSGINERNQSMNEKSQSIVERNQSINGRNPGMKERNQSVNESNQSIIERNHSINERSEYMRANGNSHKLPPRPMNTYNSRGKSIEDAFSTSLNKRQQSADPRRKTRDRIMDASASKKQITLNRLHNFFVTDLITHKACSIFRSWKLLTLSKKLSRVFFGSLLRFSFSCIRECGKTGLSLRSVKQKYSIDNLTDYELSLKITIMERKLSSLHQQLLTDQITNKALLSEKEELLLLYT